MGISVTILSATPHPFSGGKLNTSGVIFVWRLFYFVLGKDGTEVKMKVVVFVIWTVLF